MARAPGSLSKPLACIPADQLWTLAADRSERAASSTTLSWFMSSVTTIDDDKVQHGSNSTVSSMSTGLAACYADARNWFDMLFNNRLFETAVHSFF